MGIILLIMAGVAGAVAFIVYEEATRFAATAAKIEGGTVVVEIPRGSSLRTIADLLSRKGVVADPFRFYYFLRYMVRFERAGEIQAGEYEFRDGMSPRAVAMRMFRGERYRYKVTIPEGLRYEEIADILAGAGLADRNLFVKLCRDPVYIKALGVEADSLEGYLFPDTYLFERGQPIDFIIKTLVRRFREVFAPYAAGAQARGLGMHQAVTLASIVEKETGAPQERPMIASVFYNRMKIPMKLQTDPTVIYGIIRARGAFNGNLRRKDLETPNQYNTYTIEGLPPGPICNPGAEALKAVAQPAESKMLFFVSHNDGTHEFCPNYACHLKAVQKWQLDYFRRKGPARDDPPGKNTTPSSR